MVVAPDAQPGEASMKTPDVSLQIGGLPLINPKGLEAARSIVQTPNVTGENRAALRNVRSIYPDPGITATHAAEGIQFSGPVRQDPHPPDSRRPLLHCRERSERERRAPGVHGRDQYRSTR